MHVTLLRLVAVIACLSTFYACQPKLSQEEFLQWVKNYENGLHVNETFNGVVYDVQYFPPNTGTLRHWDSTKTEGLQHVTLRVGARDGGDILQRHATSPQDVQRNDYYYSYLFQQDIFLEQGDGLLPCVLFHFEHTADRHNNRVFNLAFENVKNVPKEFFLIIKSDRLSGLPVRIKLTQHALPEIKHDS